MRAGGPGHGHEGNRYLQHALHCQHLKVAYIVIAKGPENKIDDAHLQDELRNGQQHRGDQAFLLSFKVIRIAAEVRFKPVDGVQKAGAPAQESKPSHQPFGKPANLMQDGLVEQGGKKHNGAAIDSKP